MGISPLAGQVIEVGGGGFESAESCFLVADPVGEGLDGGAEVGDLCGDPCEGAWVVAVVAVFFDDCSQLV